MGQSLLDGASIQDSHIQITRESKISPVHHQESLLDPTTWSEMRLLKIKNDMRAEMMREKNGRMLWS